MPQIREQIAMVHLPPSKTLKYLFHVRKTSRACNQADYRLFPFSETGNSVLFHFFGEKIIRSPQHQSIPTDFRSRRPPVEQALSPSPVPR